MSQKMCANNLIHQVDGTKLTCCTYTYFSLYIKFESWKYYRNIFLNIFYFYAILMYLKLSTSSVFAI